MNPEIKAKWVKNLTSGKYQQTTARLCVGKSYCCLGVLLHQEFPKSKWLVSEGELTGNHLRRFGLKNSQQTTLINMNDNEGYSFERIAKWIEANL